MCTIQNLILRVLTYVSIDLQLRQISGSTRCGNCPLRIIDIPEVSKLLYKRLYKLGSCGYNHVLLVSKHSLYGPIQGTINKAVVVDDSKLVVHVVRCVVIPDLNPFPSQPLHLRTQ